MFQLFIQYNIIFKVKKKYLKYSSISFLKQKIDNLKLITSKNKLKVIITLSFSKTLKDLKIYLKMTNYLRNYIFYYAQKSKSLQRKKIIMLKKKFIRKSFKKVFNFKTILKVFIFEKIDVFNQLQTNFIKFS